MRSCVKSEPERAIRRGGFTLLYDIPAAVELIVRVDAKAVIKMGEKRFATRFEVADLPRLKLRFEGL